MKNEVTVALVEGVVWRATQPRPRRIKKDETNRSNSSAKGPGKE